jgi:hypothetical protein
VRRRTQKKRARPRSIEDKPASREILRSVGDTGTSRSMTPATAGQ